MRRLITLILFSFVLLSGLTLLFSTEVSAQACGGRVVCHDCPWGEDEDFCAAGWQTALAPCSRGSGTDGCVDGNCCADCNAANAGYTKDFGNCTIADEDDGPPPPGGGGCSAYDVNTGAKTWKCGGSCNFDYNCKKQSWKNNADGSVNTGALCKCIKKSSPGVCTIQGFKTLEPGSVPIEPAASRTILNQNTGDTRTVNPYFFSNYPESGYTIVAQGLAGYNLSASACTGNTGCHGAATAKTPINPFNGQELAWGGECPGGTYVDLWWHYGPCPRNTTWTCNPAGTQATLDWSDMQMGAAPFGYAQYILRVNKAPYWDWANLPGGDFALGTGVTSQYTFAVTPNVEYAWDVQAALHNEPYPASGCRTFTYSKCVPVAPCAAPVLPAPTQACELDGDVSLNYNWNDIPGATQYQFYFDTVNPPNALYSSPNVSSQNVPNLPQNVNRYARVRVSQSDGSCSVPGTLSAVRSVTTQTCGCGCDYSDFDCNDAALNVGQSTICTATKGACLGGANWGANVNFSSSNGLIASVSPANDNTVAYRTTATCEDEGVVTLTASSSVNNCADENTDSITTQLSCNHVPCATPNQPSFTATCELDGEVTLDCDWNSIPGTDDYRVQIDNNFDFSSPIRDNIVNSSRRVLPNRSTGVTYYCQARVNDSSSCTELPGDWSPSASITVPDNYCTTCDLSYNSLPDIYPGQTLTPTWDTLDDDDDMINYIDFRLDDNTHVAVCSTNEVECLAADPIQYTEDRDNAGEGPAWGAQVTGLSVGTTTLRATGYMENVPSAGNTTQCQNVATVDINVINPPAWWQVRGGDIISTGSIKSSVEGCVFSTCLDYLDVAQNSGFSTNYDPGIPIYGGSIIPSTEDISQKGWNAYSPYAGYNTRKEVLYTYDYFKSRVSTTTIPETLPSASEFDIAPIDAHGFRNVSAEGPLTISGPIDVQDRKVVVFVNGNLNINERINLNDGRGFILFIVNGNIIVDSGIGHSPENVSELDILGIEPELEGLFFATGQFNTGTSNLQLYVRGSIAALGNASGNPATFSDEGILLNRNLLNNAAHPAEYFEYAPDLLFNFPPSLGEKTIRWVETAP